MADTETITWIGGVKELPPITYKLVEKISGPWWWRKTEWEVHSPYCVVSDFESREQAVSFVTMASRF